MRLINKLINLKKKFEEKFVLKFLKKKFITEAVVLKFN